MAELTPPTVRVHRSFLAAMTEFRSEGRGEAGDHSMIGSEIRGHSPGWASPEGFAEFVRWLRSQALEETPRPPDRVPSTTLWWVDGEQYLGRLAIRHRLNDSLRSIGGHIGYDVRPSARRRGHATAMLRAALPISKSMGIDPALITCDVDNTASRAVIERNGGVLAELGGTAILRYWVTTAVS